MSKTIKPFMTSIPEPENSWLADKIKKLEISNPQDFIYLLLARERKRELEVEKVKS